MNNKAKLIYFSLNFLTLISVVILPFLRIDGGITDDLLYYIKIGNSFPNFKNSVWPIGYPIAIRLVNFITQDLYFATRVIAVTGFLFIILFSFAKKFYYKETSILLALKTFTVFSYSLSETLFLPFFYVLLYLLYHFLKCKRNNLSDILKISLLFTILLTIRYSAIFIVGGLILLVLFELMKRDKQKKLIKDLVSIILFSAVGFLIFLYYNYTNTGAVMGENFRNPSLMQKTTVFEFIIKNIIFSFFNAMNPIIDVIRINTFLFLSSVVLSLISVILIVFCISKTILKKRETDFQILLLFIAFSAFLGLVYSSLTTGIDGMHIRLSISVYFCIYFFILISFKEKLIYSLPFAISSILFNFLIVNQDSFNYLKKRENVKEYVLKRKSLQYYYNDIHAIPTETGGTITSNFFTIFFINPSIIEIHKKDLDFIKKYKVVKESELVKIKPINRTFMINNKSFSK